MPRKHYHAAALQRRAASVHPHRVSMLRLMARPSAHRRLSSPAANLPCCPEFELERVPSAGLAFGEIFPSESSDSEVGRPSWARSAQVWYGPVGIRSTSPIANMPPGRARAMTRRLLFVGSVAALLAGAIACQSPQSDRDGVEARTTLRVAMFPYLPALGANGEFAKRIEQEFEGLHPDVDLELLVDPSIDYYDPFVVAGWLRSKSSDGKRKEPFDLVEIDTVLLGTLVDMEAIAEWPHGDTDLVRAGYEASRLDGRQYGVPHWLCGHFIITEDEAIARADTIDKLVVALEAAKTPRPNLVGNLLGSWNTAALYIDAWADSRSNPDPLEAIRLPLDADVVACLVTFASQGMDAGANPCIDGTFNNWEDPDLAPTRFGKGKADALFGYSSACITHSLPVPIHRSYSSDPRRSAAAPTPCGLPTSGWPPSTTMRPCLRWPRKHATTRRDGSWRTSIPHPPSSGSTSTRMQ